MEKAPTIYNHYDFTLKQLDSNHKGAFCILYKDKEIASYDGIVPLLDIKKSQINFHLDYFFPMDFLRFCSDYFNFRMLISYKMYVYKETNQEFFFDFQIFDEYCSQILIIVKKGIIDFDKKINRAYDPTAKLDEHFDKIHQKVHSLIEILYNVQRNYSTNPILNSKIHVVTSYYPDFGLYYDVLKDKIKLFSENENYLILNKEIATKEDLSQYFGNLRTPAEWEPIQLLFNLKQMKQSCTNLNNEKPDKKVIEKKLKAIL